MKKIRILFTAMALCLVVLLSVFALTSCFGPDEVFEEIYDENGIDTGNARLVSVSTSGEYTVPETWEGRPVTEIGPEAFNGSNKMTKLNIPSSVEYIDLQSLKWFGMYLEEINYIGEGNYTTIDGILYSKGGEELLVYPKAHRATVYVTPDCLKYIRGECTISETWYLEELYIGDSVEQIGDWALNLQLSNGECRVRKLSIPAKFLGYNKNEMFCVTATHVKELVITNGYEIPDNALFQFDNCVEKIVLPDGVGVIGDMFTAQTLKEIYIPDSVEHIGNDFCINSKVERITLPEGLKTLGRGSFGHCYYLDELLIPDGVTVTDGWILGGSLKRLTASLSVMQRVSFNDLELEMATVTKIGTLVDEVWNTEIDAKVVTFGENVHSIPYARISLSDRVNKVIILGRVSEVSGDMLTETAVCDIILPETVVYINAASVAVRAEITLTIHHRGEESACRIDDGEIPLPENVHIAWGYIDPIEPPCQMEAK